MRTDKNQITVGMDKNYKNPITVRMDKNNKTIAITETIITKLQLDWMKTTKTKIIIVRMDKNKIPSEQTRTISTKYSQNGQEQK